MTVRDTREIPRGSKEFEAKLNRAGAAGVQDAIDRENKREERRLLIEQQRNEK